jgi:hypothetical protein
MQAVATDKMEPVIVTSDNAVSSQFLTTLATAGARAERDMYLTTPEGK